MEAEALLGVWLLSGWAKHTVWFFAVAFFLVVAGFSFYLGLMGQSACGCFGRIHVSPWNAFALDVACLGLLGLCWPSFRREQEELVVHAHQLGEVLPIVGGVTGILTLCLVGVLVAGGGRPGDFLARVRGDRVSVEPPVTDMGSDVAGQKRRFSVRLHNHTDRKITIIGGTASCACIAIDDLPVSIPPGGSALVTVRATFKGTPGTFQQEYQFYYADGEGQGWVMARVEGRIIEATNGKSE